MSIFNLPKGNFHPDRCLCFTANTAGSTIALTTYNSPASYYFDMSLNGSSWSTYKVGTVITLANVGDKVYWRNQSTTNTQLTTRYDRYYKFEMTGSIAASGDVGYLVNKLSVTSLNNYGLYRLFGGCTALTSAPALPATTLGNNCYGYMFTGCTGLTEAPKLPATTIGTSCYSGMFQNCTSLTSAPRLPAVVIPDSGYDGMFRGCTGLITGPEILATSVGQYGCRQMFYGCTSLTTAPARLPETIGYYCFYEMFRDCTSLITMPELPATTLTDSCYQYMFRGCSSLEKLPKLPATTLTSRCYLSMFENCSKIKLSTTQTGDYVNEYRIPISGTGTLGSNSLNNMFSGTGGTFNWTPAINATYYTSNTVI